MNREKLIDAGIDYDSGVHRFAGKAEIYEKYLLRFFVGDEPRTLRQALLDEDYDAAFCVAHSMKGEAGNLSITALFNKVRELTDALRANTRDSSLLVMCAEVEQLYDAACRAVRGGGR